MQKTHSKPASGLKYVSRHLLQTICKRVVDDSTMTTFRDHKRPNGFDSCATYGSASLAINSLQNLRWHSGDEDDDDAEHSCASVDAESAAVAEGGVGGCCASPTATEVVPATCEGAPSWRRLASSHDSQVAMSCIFSQLSSVL